MGLCGSSGGNPGAEARALEDQRQARITQGLQSIDQTFGKFDEGFYKKRQQDYTNFAMPQLYQQLAQTNRQGFFGLANRGLHNSSAANEFGSNLAKETNVQKQGIVDTGIAQAQQLRKDVEGQRSNLTAQLQASADPTTASQQALSVAGSYSLPGAFQPIGNLFQNFAQLYANNQIAKEYGRGGQYQSSYGLNNNPLARSPYSIKP
jgi:hypothetical protein